MLLHKQITVVVASVLVLWSIRGVLVDTIYDTTIRYRGMHKLSYQRASRIIQAAAQTLSTEKPLHSASNINKCSYSLKATNPRPEWGKNQNQHYCWKVHLQHTKLQFFKYPVFLYNNTIAKRNPQVQNTKSMKMSNQSMHCHTHRKSFAKLINSMTSLKWRQA